MSVLLNSVSFFSKVNVTKPTSDDNALYILGIIKDGISPDGKIKIIDTINKIRNFIFCPNGDKKKISELKKKLPAVTWSGTFSTRNSNNLIAYTGILCADIDDLDPNYAITLLDEMKEDGYILAAFMSPSCGIKILFSTDQDASRHLDFFEVVKTYIKKTYNADVDEKCKDIPRLCFLSHDENVHINKVAAHIFTATTKVPATKKAPAVDPPPPPAEPSLKVDYLYQIPAKIHEIVTKTITPGDGNYNQYINLYAIQANRYGLTVDECASNICYYCGWGSPDKNDLATINSVYRKFSAEHKSYPNSLSKTIVKPTISANTDNKKVSKYNTDVLFWYSIKNEKTDRNELKFSYDDAITFLHNNGFYKYFLEKGKYNLIKVDKQNHIIDIVSELEVKEYFLEFLKQDFDGVATAEIKAVREMFRRGAKSYCSANLLEGLDYYTPNIKKDDRDTAFVYFSNMYVKITKDHVVTLPYSQLDGDIWKKQIIDFKYNRLDYVNFDFNKFCIYAITGTKITPDEMHQNEDYTKKYRSLISSFGYMLHNYKNPSVTKAVVAVDSKKRTHGESNGRSGKSLIAKALAKMANQCLIDGKNFKFDNEFALDRVNADTKFINFNDVTKNFDFERLFGLITEDFIYNKKKLDSITIPFAESPKIYVSTNHTLKGGGESMLGRQQIIEVSNYFTAAHQPVHEFGKLFFSDWNQDEYCQFYTFFIDAIRFYLQNGLLQFPLENYAANKLVDTAGEDFVEVMNELIYEQLKYSKEFEKNALFEALKTQANLHAATKPNTISKWVAMWADVYGLDINIHKQGGRDRRNGKDYYTFTYKQKDTAVSTVDNADTTQVTNNNLNNTDLL
jgi:VirE N-terminal domain